MRLTQNKGKRDLFAGDRSLILLLLCLSSVLSICSRESRAAAVGLEEEVGSKGEGRRTQGATRREGEGATQPLEHTIMMTAHAVPSRSLSPSHSLSSRVLVCTCTHHLLFPFTDARAARHVLRYVSRAWDRRFVITEVVGIKPVLC